jgi:hypothetical protein
MTIVPAACPSPQPSPRKSGAREQSGIRGMVSFRRKNDRTCGLLCANLAPLLRGEVGSRSDPGEGLLVLGQ